MTRPQFLSRAAKIILDTQTAIEKGEDVGIETWDGQPLPTDLELWPELLDKLGDRWKVKNAERVGAFWLDEGPDGDGAVFLDHPEYNAKVIPQLAYLQRERRRHR